MKRLTTTSGGRAERGRSELTHTGIDHTGALSLPTTSGKTVLTSPRSNLALRARLSALRAHRGLGSLVVASSRSSLSLLTRSLQPAHLARSSLRSSLERT